jgi:hypothetical protein
MGPVPLCAMTPQPRRYAPAFCYRHYDQGLSFNEDRSYDRRPVHEHVRPARWLNTRSRTCKYETEERELIAGSSRFYIGEDAVERVSKFRYLGRILSQDDHDLSACVRNIQRAKANGLPSQGPDARGRLRSRSKVLPCDREHGPAIRKRHVGCH